ncbi:MAG: aminotransferase class IV [Acidimicrobiia bacterium]
MMVWLNGALVDADAAGVSPMDHGLLTGDGVFETLRVYDRRVFAWDRHLDRLAHSAGALALPLPDRATLRAAADAVIAADPDGNGRLRITVTGGPAPLGSERGETPPTVIVAMGTLRAFPPTEAVLVVPWTRNEHGATAGLKTISYAENVRALAHAHAHGASEAVFANTRGDLCEATGSNVFVVRDGVVRTPPGEAGCLLGVTRALVIDCCADAGIACEEVPVPMTALREADEAFLTSSTREVQAIASVDGVALPVAPGPVTLRLRAAFAALVASGDYLS